MPLHFPTSKTEINYNEAGLLEPAMQDRGCVRGAPTTAIICSSAPAREG
jgi:hypothetical protein